MQAIHGVAFIVEMMHKVVLSILLIAHLIRPPGSNHAVGWFRRKQQHKVVLKSIWSATY